MYKNRGEGVMATKGAGRSTGGEILSKQITEQYNNLKSQVQKYLHIEQVKEVVTDFNQYIDNIFKTDITGQFNNNIKQALNDIFKDTKSYASTTNLMKKQSINIGNESKQRIKAVQNINHLVAQLNPILNNLIQPSSSISNPLFVRQSDINKLITWVRLAKQAQKRVEALITEGMTPKQIAEDDNYSQLTKILAQSLAGNFKNEIGAVFEAVIIYTLSEWLKEMQKENKYQNVNIQAQSAASFNKQGSSFKTEARDIVLTGFQGQNDKGATVTFDLGLSLKAAPMKSYQKGRYAGQQGSDIFLRSTSFQASALPHLISTYGDNSPTLFDIVVLFHNMRYKKLTTTAPNEFKQVNTKPLVTAWAILSAVLDVLTQGNYQIGGTHIYLFGTKMYAVADMLPDQLLNKSQAADRAFTLMNNSLIRGITQTKNYNTNKSPNFNDAVHGLASPAEILRKYTGLSYTIKIQYIIKQINESAGL